ncbi:DNA recombination protein RmuC [candidate division KSB1 bacterium]|nr:DNA recombination protein RmuC [candidate division KSB1 bacterium]
MEWVTLIIGIIIGFAIAFAWNWKQGKSAKEIAVELHETNKQAFLEEIKLNFGNLSLEAMQKFLNLADSTIKSAREKDADDLDKKKSLIDQQLKTMTLELDKVAKLMRELETDRENKFGELTNQLKSAGEQTAKLTVITGKLRETLASEHARGQWGERMAEDVLNIIGFVENINYQKAKTISESNTRTDFTIFLTRGYKVNMDVKFPFDNYVKYCETDSEMEMEKSQYKKRFLKDVRGHIKEITTRNYINHEQNTVDYVLLFIPNEQIFSFIHEQDSNILDDALKIHVIICSPITLFAVLAIIRQAVENFAYEQRSNEVVNILNAFRKQWKMFVEKLEKLGKRIGDAQKDYDELIGTRKNQLDRHLNKLDAIKTQRELPPGTEEDIDEYKM